MLRARGSDRSDAAPGLGPWKHRGGSGDGTVEGGVRVYGRCVQKRIDKCTHQLKIRFAVRTIFP